VLNESPGQDTRSSRRMGIAGVTTPPAQDPGGRPGQKEEGLHPRHTAGRRPSTRWRDSIRFRLKPSVCDGGISSLALTARSADQALRRSGATTETSDPSVGEASFSGPLRTARSASLPSDLEPDPPGDGHRHRSGGPHRERTYQGGLPPESRQASGNPADSDECKSFYRHYIRIFTSSSL